MMETKKNFIFFTIIFTLIFPNIPKLFQLNFLAGGLASKLTIYPIFLAIVFTVLYRKKFSLSPTERSNIAKYFVIYLLVELLTLIIGLFTYPYYNEILQGPVNQIEKLPGVYAFLTRYGISISEQDLLSVWMLVRPIKNLFVNTFWAYCLSVLTFIWYKDDFHDGFHVFLFGVFVSVIVVVLYGFWDVLYLSGNEFAAKVLMTFNPLIHEIKSDGTWWPPLLWKNQFRSLFAEPSYYGIFMAFALPWLWCILDICKNDRKRILCWLVSFCCITFLFLTKSRTANVLLFGELVLLLLFRLCWFSHSKKILFSVYLSVILAFSASLSFFNYGVKYAKEATVSNYLEDNITSLGSIDKRSNRSRYSIMIADLKIGISHPILGVGLSLRNAYIPEYLPDKTHLSQETLTWIRNQQEKGILRSGFPRLGEYTIRFAETGILGLIVFMFPPIILIYKLLQFIRAESRKMKIENKIIMYFFISFLGILAAGIGDSLNITCCYWLLLGLGFALLHHVMIKANEEE